MTARRHDKTFHHIAEVQTKGQELEYFLYEMHVYLSIDDSYDAKIVRTPFII